MKQIFKFYADWCGPCKALQSRINLLPEDQQTKFIPIDMETVEGSEMGKKYGVRGLPTMVVVDGEKQLATIVGLISQKQLEQIAI